MTTTEFVSTAHAAAELGITQRQVINLLHQGKFPNAARVPTSGRPYWVIPRSDIAALKRRRQEGKNVVQPAENPQNN